VVWQRQKRSSKAVAGHDQQALLNLGLPFRLKDVENLTEDQQVRHLSPDTRCKIAARLQAELKFIAFLGQPV